jgi:porphobilinogen synthase
MSGSGIGSVAFRDPERKDEWLRGFAGDGIVQQAVGDQEKVTDFCGEDVCLSVYTDHGQCGMIEKGEVHYDLTWRCWRKRPSSCEGGGGYGGPSAMMSVRSGAIREGW